MFVLPTVRLRGRVRELYRLAHGPLVVPAILAFRVGAPALSRCAPLGLDLVIRIGKDPLIGYFHLPRHPYLYVHVLVLCTLINLIEFQPYHPSNIIYITNSSKV